MTVATWMERRAVELQGELMDAQASVDYCLRHMTDLKRSLVESQARVNRLCLAVKGSKSGQPQRAA